jgi:Cdc6-like AAA superfamily ATPase
MSSNKRKHMSPLKAEKQFHHKKIQTKHRTKSHSKDNNTESSSSNIKIDDLKDKTPIELFNMKDITEKLGNSKIFCRDDEKKEILDFIRSKDKNKKTLFVSGQPGTGKTSLITEIFNTNLIDDQNYFLKFSINCLSINSIDDFYESLFKYLNDPTIYNYFNEVLDEKKQKNIIKILKETPSQNSFQKILIILGNIAFTILLDEIDFLYKKRDDFLFFSLLLIPYLTNNGVKMILISNNSDFDNEIFPKLKNRNITIKKLIFKPYTHKQLANIMTLKLESIGLLKYFSNDAIKFLSTKMNKSGDIRPVISIIKEIILNNKDKIQNNTDFKIVLSDMFEIIRKKNINLSDILSSMTTEQKIVVAAIYYVCKNSGIKFEEKLVFEKYKNIKHFTNTPILNTEEFRDIMKTFIDVGLIESLSNFGKGRKKMTIMYKAKYSDDDLSLIFQDPIIFTLFNSNQDEEDEKIEKEGGKVTF